MSLRARLAPAVIVALGVTAMVLPLAAFAGPGGAPTITDRIFDDAGIDNDFCGTGATVAFDGRVVANVWIGETGADPEQVLKASFTYRYTLTNPLNGNAVIDSAAGSSTNVIVAGQEAGAHTHEFTENGLRAKLQLANGRVLTRDAGTLTWLASFDDNGEFVDLEILHVGGPHDAFASDLWCDTAIDALGL